MTLLVLHLCLAVSASTLCALFRGCSFTPRAPARCSRITLLFQFSGLQGTNLAAILFVVYGVGVIYLIGTINAVANVPVKSIEKRF